MSMRAKFITGVVLTALALALWRFMSSEPAIEGRVTRVPSTGTANVSTELGTRAIRPSRPAKDPPAEAGTPYELNERTLVGTKWEREGFGLEFGADGKLFIGGRERAKWRVEGSRIRLYRDTTPSGREPEEHWLDIVGNKLMWEGQEIGRAPGN